MSCMVFSGICTKIITRWSRVFLKKMMSSLSFLRCQVFCSFISALSMINGGCRQQALALWPMALGIFWCMMLSFISASNGLRVAATAMFALSGGHIKCITNILIVMREKALVCCSFIESIGIKSGGIKN